MIIIVYNHLERKWCLLGSLIKFNDCNETENDCNLGKGGHFMVRF